MSGNSQDSDFENNHLQLHLTRLRTLLSSATGRLVAACLRPQFLFVFIRVVMAKKHKIGNFSLTPETRNARKLIKGSKGLEFSLVSNKNLVKILPSSGWAQG